MIDLRSDTVTQPSPAMLAAMQQAPTGDDVYGEDPTVNALEARVAAMTQMEAAMFVSSGTQSNLIALLVHCQRGDEYLVGQRYHTYLYEAGGAATLGGIQPQPMAVEADGTLDLARVEALIKPDDVHFARSRLLALENTWHGQAIAPEYFAEARALAKRTDLNVHLDGARIFNAAVKLGVELSDFSRQVDSLSICFSKGLGAPVGSILCGSHAFIQQARRYRKMLGGGLRQAGVLAAAAHYALDHHIKDLADDHRRAAWLGEQLQALCTNTPDTRLASVATNMLYLQLPGNEAAESLAARLAEQQVRVSAAQPMRLVIHRDIDDAAIERVAAAFRVAISCR